MEAAWGWRPRLIPKGFSIKHPPAMRGNHVGVHVRSNDTSAAQGLVMRGPHGCHLFASWNGLAKRDTRWKSLIWQYTKGIMIGAYSRYKRVSTKTIKRLIKKLLRGPNLVLRQS